MNQLGKIDTGDIESTKTPERELLWKVISKQVDMLRAEIQGSRKSAKDAVQYDGPTPVTKAGFS